MLNIGTVVALIKKLAPVADQATIVSAVNAWMDEHPEVTIEDGSVTEAKLASAVATKLNQVTQLSEEIATLDGRVDALENGSGLTETLKSLLLELFQSAVYTSDKSATISALESELAIISWSQSGSTLTFVNVPNITSITKTGYTLTVA